MLKTVVDPRASSMSIGIFLFVVNIDYSVALGTMGYLAKSLNISPKLEPHKYGELVGYLCIGPVFLAIFVFLIAGCKAKNLKKKNEKEGRKTGYEKHSLHF